MSCEAFETYGVPTHYVNVAIPEPAGSGNMRIWNCTRKNGMIVPVCEIIIPAVDLLVAARTVVDAAMDVFRMERSAFVH